MAISNAERAYNLAIRRKKPKIGHVINKLVSATAAQKLKEGNSTGEAVRAEFDSVLDRILKLMAERLQKKKDADNA